MTEERTSIPPCLIFIDREGRWFHQGAEMIHREFIRLFYQDMELDSEGRYLLTWGGTRCYVEVEDTAHVVRRVSAQEGDGGRGSHFRLYLSDDTEEILDPGSLYVGKDHVLYCRIKAGAFPARFTRAAYYQLAEFIEADDRGFFLPVSGERYYIPSSAAQ